jgi:hypothetical protein
MPSVEQITADSTRQCLVTACRVESVTERALRVIQFPTICQEAASYVSEYRPTIVPQL